MSNIVHIACVYLFLVDQDVVVPLVLGGARRPRAPEAEGDAHVGERDDGQRHEVLHDQQRNAETERKEEQIGMVPFTGPEIITCYGLREIG